MCGILPISGLTTQWLPGYSIYGWVGKEINNTSAKLFFLFKEKSNPHLKTEAHANFLPGSAHESKKRRG